MDILNDKPAHVRGFEHWYVSRNISETAQIVGVSRQTVQNWHKKYNWDELAENRERKDIDNTFDRLSDDIIGVSKQLFKINDELLKKFLIDLKNNKIKINTVSEYFKLAELFLKIASLMSLHTQNNDDNSKDKYLKDAQTLNSFTTFSKEWYEVIGKYVEDN